MTVEGQQAVVVLASRMGLSAQFLQRILSGIETLSFGVHWR